MKEIKTKANKSWWKWGRPRGRLSAEVTIRTAGVLQQREKRLLAGKGADDQSEYYGGAVGLRAGPD